MRRIHFIVPIGADQQQVGDIRLRQQILQQVKRRRVEPLQVVEKEGQGMFRSCEHTEESAKYQMEPPLSVLRRKFGNRWLLSENGFQFRNQSHHQLSVRIECLSQGLAPRAQLLFALTQKWSDKALKGLREGGIRDIALVLVKLARCKKATRRNER